MADNQALITAGADTEPPSNVDLQVLITHFGSDSALPSKNPALKYIASLKSVNSQRTMRGVLNVIAQMLSGDKKADIYSVDWSYLDDAMAFVVLRLLTLDKRSASTKNKYISAMRGVAKKAFVMTLIDANQYYRMTLVEHDKARTLPAGRALSKEEVNQLIEPIEAGEKDIDIRDSALVNILFRSGIRRDEIIKLKLQDFDPQERCIKVIGKGGHHRLVPLHTKTITALNKWIDIRGSQNGPLFVSMDTQGNMRNTTEDPMSASGIYDIVVRRGKRAGLKHISPHDMRRTCLTSLLDSDVDIGTVASIAGHVSVDTTRIYDRRQDKRNEKAIQLLDF